MDVEDSATCRHNCEWRGRAQAGPRYVVRSDWGTTPRKAYAADLMPKAEGASAESHPDASFFEKVSKPANILQVLPCSPHNFLLLIFWSARKAVEWTEAMLGRTGKPNNEAM